MEDIFQSGLHEFLGDFMADNNRLSAEIARTYNFPMRCSSRSAIPRITAIDVPASYAVQRLMLTPLDFASQKVRSWAIEAPGIAKALSYRDGFGNLVHVVTTSGTHRRGYRRRAWHRRDQRCRRRGARARRARCRRRFSCARPRRHGLAPRSPPWPMRRSWAAAIRSRNCMCSCTMIRARIVYRDRRHDSAYHGCRSARRRPWRVPGPCPCVACRGTPYGLPARYVTGYIVTGDGAVRNRKPCLGGSADPDARLGRIRCGKRGLPDRAICASGSRA